MSVSVLTLRKWHRWLGWGAAVFFLLVSVTGVLLQAEHIFGEEEAHKEAVRELTSSYPLDTVGLRVLPGIAAASEAVRRSTGDVPLDRVVVDLKDPHPTVTLDVGGAAPQRYTVSLGSSAILRREPAEDESWLVQLHTGEIVGDAGVVLGLLWGTALVVMTVTGVWIYVRMRRQGGVGIKRVFWVWPILFALALGNVQAVTRTDSASPGSDAFAPPAAAVS